MGSEPTQSLISTITLRIIIFCKKIVISLEPNLQFLTLLCYYLFYSLWLLFRALTLPRRGYRVCGSEGGGLLKPPLRNQWRSGLRPHVAIDILLRCKFRAHMQKIGPLSRKLSEISRFKNLVKLSFHDTLVYKNRHNSLNFEATGLIFCMQSWFY